VSSPAKLARLYQARGRYSEAEPLLKRSLAIDEKTVGGEHPDTSATLQVLASLYQAQGRNAEAEPLLRAAIAALEAKVTPEHVSLKAARATLAAIEGKHKRR
jgi:tetratricopeptide (TPR) repeat protein